MRKRLAQATLAILIAGACGGPTSPSGSLSLSVGQWAGTTDQGAAISFEVSSAETLTSLSVAYSFNGCSGMQTYSNLNISTRPTVICIPGPCPPNTPSSRTFAFSDGTPGSSPVTMVNGLFILGGRAQGIASFRDYPGCGTADRVAWTATRR
ncbi:MAG: hypothetical protein WD690_14470 [Vicinamibacterales bacterium]